MEGKKIVETLLKEETIFFSRLMMRNKQRSLPNNNADDNTSTNLAQSHESVKNENAKEQPALNIDDNNNNNDNNIVKVDQVQSSTNRKTLQPEENQMAETNFCGPFLLRSSQVPSWYSYGCTQTGYRPIVDSYDYCFRSMFVIHNETMNIWTHLIGCVLFAALFVSAIAYCPPMPQMQKLDWVMVTMFFVSICTCLTISTAFHTLACYSESMHAFLAK